MSVNQPQGVTRQTIVRGGLAAIAAALLPRVATAQTVAELGPRVAAVVPAPQPSELPPGFKIRDAWTDCAKSIWVTFDTAEYDAEVSIMNITPVANAPRLRTGIRYTVGISRREGLGHTSTFHYGGWVHEGKHDTFNLYERHTLSGQDGWHLLKATEAIIAKAAAVPAASTCELIPEPERHKYIPGARQRSFKETDRELVAIVRDIDAIWRNHIKPKLQVASLDTPRQ